MILLALCLCFTNGMVRADPPLSGTHLEVVIIESPPFVAFEQNSTYRGFLVDTLEELQNRLGFTYSMYPVPDGKYGHKTESGEWSGMVGELIKQKADMALAPLTITADRSKDILFSIPYMDAGILPLYVKPQPKQPLPFHNLMSLVTETELKYGTVSEGSSYQFFKNSQYKLYEEMGKYMTNNSAEVQARDIMEAAARVREGGYVFLGEEPMLSWLTGEEPCDLMTIGKPINARTYALAFPQGAKRIAEAFNEKILEMKEEGMLQIFKERWWEDDCNQPKLCVCEKNVSSEESKEED